MPDKWEYPWFAAWDLAFHCAAARLRRSRLRARAAIADAAGALPAPERAAPRLRVELRRRQPAGARLGDAVQLSPQPRQPRRPGAAVPQAHVQHAGHQLHLVVEPKGPQRPQPVRGRVPRPRQHRRVRPQRAAADGRLPGASRRDGLDGVLRPEHARHGAGAGAGRFRPTRTFAIKFYEHVVSIASAINRRGEQDSLWDRRTGSSTTCCACPGQFTTRLKVRSIVGLLPLCAVSVYNAEVVAQPAALRRTGAVVQREPARAARQPESAGAARRPAAAT